MTWLRVDDKFWAHPKVEALEAFGPRIWADAIALWTIAGSYSDSGMVNVSRLRRLVPMRSTKRAVDALVEVGLWRRVNGEAVAFHDWADYQPSANQTRADAEPSASRRRADAEPNANRSPAEREPTPSRARADADPTPNLYIPPHDIAGENMPPDPTRPEPDPTRVVNGSVATSESLWPLSRGYASRYEQATDTPWMSHTANDREIRQVAAWLDASGADVESWLDAWFADVWAAEHRWPWKHAAKDPAKFLAPKPKDASKAAQQIKDRIDDIAGKLRYEAREKHQEPLRAELAKLRAELGEVSP